MRRNERLAALVTIAAWILLAALLAAILAG